MSPFEIRYCTVDDRRLGGRRGTGNGGLTWRRAFSSRTQFKKRKDIKNAFTDFWRKRDYWEERVEKSTYRGRICHRQSLGISLQHVSYSLQSVFCPPALSLTHTRAHTHTYTMVVKMRVRWWYTRSWCQLPSPCVSCVSQSHCQRMRMSFQLLFHAPKGQTALCHDSFPERLCRWLFYNTYFH